MNTGRQRGEHIRLSLTKISLDVGISIKIQLDLRIGKPMQICIQPERQLTKASEPSFDLEGVAKDQI